MTTSHPKACDPTLACDTDGMLGMSGTVHAGLLADVMLTLPYFAMSAPKTTGKVSIARLSVVLLL